MRVLLLQLATIVFCLHTQGQSPEQFLYKEPLPPGSKKPIDFKGIEQWRAALSSVDFRSATLSRDGRYCSYATREGVVVQSTENAWKLVIPGIKPGFFAGNNRQYVYQSKDSLYLLSLGGSASLWLSGVTTYLLPTQDDRNEWTAVTLRDGGCVLKNLLKDKEHHFANAGTPSFSHNNWFSYLHKTGQLSVVQLASGKTTQYEHVRQYRFAEQGQVLILQQQQGEQKSLAWANPGTGQLKEVWSTTDKHTGIGMHQVDASGKQLLFFVNTQLPDKPTKSIWYYRVGMEQATARITNSTIANLDTVLELTGYARFGEDGQTILFDLTVPAAVTHAPKPNAVQLDVWHYKDKFLMSAQLEDISYRTRKKGALSRSRVWQKPLYRAAINTKEPSKALLLTNPTETLFRVQGSYALIRIDGEPTNRDWEQLPASYAVLSLKDNTRTPLRNGMHYCAFPPTDEGWILCFDATTKQYWRYNFASNSYQLLSATITHNLARENEFHKLYESPNPESEDFFWLPRRGTVLVNDYYDIWELDVSGKKAPVNITGGYGRKNNTRFDILRCKGEQQTSTITESRLLLSAVNMTTMETGFYAIRPDKPANPEPLCMGQHLQYLPNRLTYGHLNPLLLPVKARDADVWLVQRRSSSTPPNLYMTRDMKTMQQLTHVASPQGYYWYTSELVPFTQQDGSSSKGLLFKPENFDPHKKYPVLIHYYFQESIRLHDYIEPDYTNDAHINIPWFVSRGYLVFVPDLYLNKAIKDAAALNAVEGAASWLAGQPYVDSTKMGIAGHSNAGGMTNYIVTHSNRFAAAFEGAGTSDHVSSNLQLAGASPDKNGWPRLRESIGKTLGIQIWTNPAINLENSILHVDKVSSPLLMFHCKNDGAVPFEQAIELFTAMWRLGKKAWLLQYDGEGHNLLKKNNKTDLTIRVTQFFDHYLKGAPAPVWMTRGIDARLKGIETGLELDKADVQP